MCAFLSPDAELDSLASNTINSLNLASGDTLQLSGTNVTINQTILVTSIPNLVYTPADSTKGAIRSTFGFTVNDEGSGTVQATMTIDVSNDFVYHAPLLQMDLDLDVFVLNSSDPVKAELVVREHNTTNVLKQKKISEIDKLVDIKTAGKVYILTGMWTDGDEVSVTASNIEVKGNVSTVKLGVGATERGKVTLTARNKSNDILSGITGALPIFSDSRNAPLNPTDAALTGGEN